MYTVSHFSAGKVSRTNFTTYEVADAYYGCLVEAHPTASILLTETTSATGYIVLCTDWFGRIDQHEFTEYQDAERCAEDAEWDGSYESVVIRGIADFAVHSDSYNCSHCNGCRVPTLHTVCTDCENDIVCGNSAYSAR